MNPRQKLSDSDRKKVLTYLLLHAQVEASGMGAQVSYHLPWGATSKAAGHFCCIALLPGVFGLEHAKTK